MVEVEKQDEVAVLVVDDDAIVRAWVRASLQGSELRVAGEAASAAEARSLIAQRRVDVLLLDYRLPDVVATEFLHALRREGVAAPALVMTANPVPGLNEAARESGAQGVVRKRGDSEELLHALREVAAGREVADAEHPLRKPGATALSPRERATLRLAAEGHTNGRIARDLGLGVETVKTMLGRAYTKLGVHSRTEAVAEALRRDLL